MPLRAPLLALTALCLLPPACLRGQSLETPPIATDRPSVGTAPDITHANSLQLESGINFAYSRKGYAADLPETLSRLGIGHGLELRFTSANLQHPMYVAPGGPFMQAQDMVFGVKAGLSTPNHVQPQTVLATLSFPTGAAGQTSGTHDPGVLVIWQQAVGGGVSVTEEVGALYTSAYGSRRTNWNPSLFVSRAISPKLTWFAEYAPTFAAGTDPLHIVDGGILYALTPLTQLDFRTGYQNDSAGLHNLLSFGYSFRLDGISHRRFLANR